MRTGPPLQRIVPSHPCKKGNRKKPDANQCSSCLFSIDYFCKNCEELKTHNLIYDYHSSDLSFLEPGVMPHPYWIFRKHGPYAVCTVPHFFLCTCNEMANLMNAFTVFTYYDLVYRSLLRVFSKTFAQYKGPRSSWCLSEFIK